MTKSVVLGMSGGLDSASTAIKLKRAGFKVLGVFLDLHGHSQNGDRERLKAISRKLEIEIRTIVRQDLFAEKVMKPFAEEYAMGHTPNPCVVCNEKVKFLSLMETASAEKADYVATGHYARILQREKGLFQLCRGLDPKKDQSYVLYRLPKTWLRSLLFPLGNSHKKENIALGKEIFGSMFDEVPESSDLCFLPDGDRSALTGKGQPGPILDQNGHLLGQHKGLIWYTIGQRKGLGLPGGPWYVLNLDLKQNCVIVGRKTDLDVRDIRVTGSVWHANPERGRIYHAQYRYRSQPAPVRITSMEGDSFTALPLTPTAGVAPGQSLVLYDEDQVVGGGFIETFERRFV